jgi:N utilization substance protein B
MQKSRGSVAKRRRNARQKAMQALYQWDFDADTQSISHIVDQFCDLQNMDKVDVEYFRELFYYAAKNLQAIDEQITSYLDRPMERLDPVEKSVLRIACAELRSRLDTPYKVVVNEAVEVAKLFGAEDGHKFVNGIADKLAADIRTIEYKPADRTPHDKPDVPREKSPVTQSETPDLPADKSDAPGNKPDEQGQSEESEQSDTADSRGDSAEAFAGKPERDHSSATGAEK